MSGIVDHLIAQKILCEAEVPEMPHDSVITFFDASGVFFEPMEKKEASERRIKLDQDLELSGKFEALNADDAPLLCEPGEFHCGK